MDIGALIKAPMEDKDWIKKILIMGLIMLIPIVGLFNALGYIKGCYEARKAGQTTLPEAGFGHLGAGWWIFVSFLPIVALMILLSVLITVLAIVSGQISHSLAGVVGLGGNLLLFVVALALWAAFPAIMYLHLVKGERWASVKFTQIIALMKTNLTPYLWLWLAFLLAGVIGGVGQIACGIGIILTLPFSYAMQGAAIADFEKQTSA